MTSGDANDLAPIHAVEDVDPGDGSSPTETASPLVSGPRPPIPGQPDGVGLFRRLFERERDVRVLRAVLDAREEAFRVLMARLVDAEKMCARLRLQEQDLREEIRRLTDVRDLEVRHHEEELRHHEEELRHHEEELRHHEEELVRHHEEELRHREEELVRHHEEELRHREEELVRHHEEEVRHREEEMVRHREEEVRHREEEVRRREEQERLVDQGTERLLAARERERMLGEEVRRLTEERDEARDAVTRIHNSRIMRYTKPLRTIWAYCRRRFGIQPESSGRRRPESKADTEGVGREPC